VEAKQVVPVQPLVQAQQVAVKVQRLLVAQVRQAEARPAVLGPDQAQQVQVPPQVEAKHLDLVEDRVLQQVEVKPVVLALDREHQAQQEAVELVGVAPVEVKAKALVQVAQSSDQRSSKPTHSVPSTC